MGCALLNFSYLNRTSPDLISTVATPLIRARPGCAMLGPISTLALSVVVPKPGASEALDEVRVTSGDVAGSCESQLIRGMRSGRGGKLEEGRSGRRWERKLDRCSEAFEMFVRVLGGNV